MLCHKCHSTIPDYSLVCTKCGVELSQNARRANDMGAGFGMGSIPNVLPQSMMWFYILISFYLFFDAVSSLFTATEYIFGSFDFLKTVNGTELITSFGQIAKKYKFIDIIYGCIFVLVAVWAVVLRFQLAKFKKNAPFYLLLYFSIPSVISLIYNVSFLIVFDILTPEDILSLIIQLAIQGAIVYANYIYFKKRKHLFKN